MSVATEEAVDRRSGGESRQAVRAQAALRAGLRARLPLVVLLVGLGCQAVLLLSRVGRGWFGVDALHYLAQRGAVTAPTESLMEPYAGHWQPLLILGYRTLFEFFALDTYLPYVLPAVVVHLGLCLLLYVACTRLGANRWAAVLGSLTLAWFGAGGEAYLADAPVALTSTVLVAYACVLLVCRRSWGRRPMVLVAVLLVAALMVSNAALTAVLFVGLVLLARRGWIPAAILVGTPALVYGAWFLALGREADRGRFTSGDLLLVPERALSLLVAPFDSIAPGGLGGALLLLVVAGPFLSSRVSADLRAVAAAGMVAALAQSALCVVANLQLGADAVLVGRYQYVVLAYLTPAMVVSLAWFVDVATPLLAGPVRTRMAPIVVAVGLVALMVVHGIAEQNVVWSVTRAEAARAEMLTKGGVASIALGERMLAPEAGGFTVHGDDIQTLGEVGGARWASLVPTAEQRLSAEALMFSAAGPETFYVQAPASVRSTSFDARLRSRFGCQVVVAEEANPQITLQSFDGAQIAVQSDSTSVTAVLSRDGGSADPVVWQLSPGETTYLATTAQLAELSLTFDRAGSYRICRS